MEYTNKLNLLKPSENDYYNINHFNDNADIIDNNINQLSNKPAMNLNQTQVNNLINGKLADGSGINPVIGKTDIAVGLAGSQIHIKNITLPNRDYFGLFEIFINGAEPINKNAGLRIMGLNNQFCITQGNIHLSTNMVNERNNNVGQWITKGINANYTGNYTDDDYKIVGTVNHYGENILYRGIWVNEHNKNAWYSPFSGDSQEAFKTILNGIYLDNNILKIVFRTSSNTVIHSDIIYKVQ